MTLRTKEHKEAYDGMPKQWEKTKTCNLCWECEATTTITDDIGSEFPCCEECKNGK